MAWLPSNYRSWGGSFYEFIFELAHGVFDQPPTGRSDPTQLMSAGWRHPTPCPWLVEGLVSAVGVRQLAATLPDGPTRTQMQKSADTTIAQILDDYCGTPPRLVPWPWPGPPPWAYEIAAELTAVANTMHGDMRDALLAVAAQFVTDATTDQSRSASV